MDVDLKTRHLAKRKALNAPLLPFPKQPWHSAGPGRGQATSATVLLTRTRGTELGTPFLCYVPLAQKESRVERSEMGAEFTRLRNFCKTYLPWPIRFRMALPRDEYDHHRAGDELNYQVLPSHSARESLVANVWFRCKDGTDQVAVRHTLLPHQKRGFQK
jgi:hypothetical protein